MKTKDDLKKITRGKKFYVGESKIAGKGIFAARDIKKGEIVFVMKGKVIRAHMKTKKEAIDNPNMIGIDKDTWIDPKIPGSHINHSCNPNLGTRGRYWFVSLRSVKKEEEMTFDYSISEDSLWEMKCNCGAKNCRKIIRGIRYLPVSSFMRYLPYIPKYFQEVYLKLHTDTNTMLNSRKI